MLSPNEISNHNFFSTDGKVTKSYHQTKPGVSEMGEERRRIKDATEEDDVAQLQLSSL